MVKSQFRMFLSEHESWRFDSIRTYRTTTVLTTSHDRLSTKLKKYQLLTEEEYRKARESSTEEFEAEMGAEALKKLLEGLDLVKLSRELRDQLDKELRKGTARADSLGDDGAEERAPGEKKERVGKPSKQKLRDFVDHGGFLFAEACCSAPEFDHGFRRLMKEVFPENEAQLQPLPGIVRMEVVCLARFQNIHFLGEPRGAALALELRLQRQEGIS